MGDQAMPGEVTDVDCAYTVLTVRNRRPPSRDSRLRERHLLLKRHQAKADRGQPTVGLVQYLLVIDAALMVAGKC